MFRNVGKKLYGMVVLTLALCGVAMAVWYVQGKIEGTSQATKAAKKVTPSVVPIKVAFAAEGLEPGTSEPIEFTIENTSPGATEVTFHNIAVTMTSSNEAECPKTNYTVTTTNVFWKEVLEGKQTTATKVAPGATYNPESVLAAFKLNLSAAAPIACETALLTVKAVAS